MARTIHKLTPAFAERKSKKPGLHGDGGGLYLCVTPPSARSWVFRYMLGGKAREMGLGSYPEVSLEAARVAASEARALKAQGRDPIEARESVRASQRLRDAKAITFRHCAESYIDAHRQSWRSAKHGLQWKATLETYAMPVIGDLPVGDVDRALVIRVLEPIWKTKTETASRLRGRIEVVLDWAAAREYRAGENPARWKGALDKLFPARARARKVKHHAALPYAEVPAFMAALKAEERLGMVKLQFTILTAARTGEALNAQWPEFDLDKAVWTIPGERMKSGREHRVPLSKPVLAVLRARHAATGGTGHVFPGARPHKPVSRMMMWHALRCMGRADLTVHGFRSSFRDWVEDTTNYSGAVAEAALAHVVGDKVEAAYRRGDLFEKRRKLMAAWATFCTTPAEAAKVIPIGRRKQEVATA